MQQCGDVQGRVQMPSSRHGREQRVMLYVEAAAASAAPTGEVSLRNAEVCCRLVPVVDVGTQQGQAHLCVADLDNLFACL
jgi:hypothetical protein